MAILNILRYPDPRLRKQAAPVNTVDDKVRQTVSNMFETMYDASGIGLAATQVNIQQEIIVIDISEKHNEPLCLINPKILMKDGIEEGEEGCLSVPGYYEKVTRAERIKINAINEKGDRYELETDGLLAVCIQHEMDHLRGKLFVDYLSPLKQQRARKKMLKQNRQKRT